MLRAVFPPTLPDVVLSDLSTLLSYQISEMYAAFLKCLMLFHITIFMMQLDKKREWEMMCRVKPDVAKDRDSERNLQRIATR